MSHDFYFSENKRNALREQITPELVSMLLYNAPATNEGFEGIVSGMLSAKFEEEVHFTIHSDYETATIKISDELHEQRKEILDFVCSTTECEGDPIKENIEPRFKTIFINYRNGRDPRE